MQHELEEPKDGWCPVCNRWVAEVPNTGVCAHCSNHLLAGQPGEDWGWDFSFLGKSK